MDVTPNLTLPYLMAAQAQKHVTHNEAIRMLDAIVQLAVLDRSLTSPPASPADGDRYIVAAGATGGWSGKDGLVAAWQDGAWAFLTPRAGWLAWVSDETALLVHNGTAWAAAGTGGGIGGALGSSDNRLVRTDGTGGATLQPTGITVSDGNGMSGLASLLVNANGVSQPQLEAYCDNGTDQANITATSYGIDGGGIIHGNHARGTRASPSATQKGDITGGIGSRAYHSGGAFHTSSPASVHWVAAENQTASANGMYLRFLTTPVGGTTRAERVVIAPDGTLWCHDDHGTFDPTSSAQTRPVGDTFILASGYERNVAFGAFAYQGATAATVGYRGGIAGGTPAAPSATQIDMFLCFMGGHGHDGTNWTAGTKALLAFKASENWSATAQGTYISFNTTKTGTTTRSEVMRCSPAANLLIGGTADPASAAGAIVLFNKTAPTGGVTDGVVLFAQDVSASSELRVRDEAGNTTTLSPHNFDLIPGGASEAMAWAYHSERDGRSINVDMLRVVRAVERLAGETLVYEGRRND